MKLKTTLDLGSSMFENQLLNLNIYAVTSQQQTTNNEIEAGGGSTGGDSAVVGGGGGRSAIGRNRMTPKLGATQQTLSVESNNSGSGAGSASNAGGKRRQLPQIPFEKQKENRDKSK